MDKFRQISFSETLRGDWLLNSALAPKTKGDRLRIEGTEKCTQPATSCVRAKSTIERTRPEWPGLTLQGYPMPKLLLKKIHT